MEKLILCNVAVLSTDPDKKHRYMIEELVDSGFYIAYLDVSSGRANTKIKAWVMHHGFAPSGIHNQGGAWVISRQPSLADLPASQWQRSILEFLDQVIAPELFLVVSQPENHAVIKAATLHHSCHLLLASDLAQAVAMVR